MSEIQEYQSAEPGIASPESESSGKTPIGGSRTIPALTGIRFFAAVYVFVFHSGASALDRAGAPRLIATFLHNGFFGVSAFFVLSGFILAHAHPKTISGSTDYLNYAISRFARIYPTYLFALILALPLSIESLNPRKALAVLFMIQSWGGASSDTGYSWIVQAWTLSVELGFYILFPFLATCLRRLRKRALICIFLIDSVLLVTFGISVIHPGSVDSDTLKSIGITSGSNWLAYFPLPLARLPEFILGMLIQCIVRDVPRGWAQNSNAAIFCMIALAVSVLSSTTSGHVISIATILFGGLIAILYTSEANVFTAFLGSRPLRVLGSASYAFYLLQGPLHAYMLMFVVSPYGRLFALPVIILASVVAWHFVEEPCRKYIVRFRRKSDSPDMKPKWIRSGA